MEKRRNKQISKFIIQDHLELNSTKPLVPINWGQPHGFFTPLVSVEGHIPIYLFNNHVLLDPHHNLGLFQTK